MLFRKIESVIYQHLRSSSDKIMVVAGARQIGKSFIIRHVGSKLFKNFFEINLVDDFNGERIFANVRSVEDFKITLSAIAGNRLGNASNTLVFLDEIQIYPHLLTMLKFLREDGSYRYIASGSLLGVTLRSTVSVPIGSIEILHMYPLDFEEFLIANNVGQVALDTLKDCFENRKSVPESLHLKVMDLFRRYLIVGGMPDAVNSFLKTHNIMVVRQIQLDIHNLYGVDASQYDQEHKLKIQRIYELIPSNLENHKKRLIFKEIENRTGARAEQFSDEIDYLVSSGIALETKAVSNPKFPLLESAKKNLIKLYLNDVGILTALLYRNNVRAILDDSLSVNLGSVYECAAAMELTAHGNKLFYYDNKTHGEVDFLFDDFSNLSVAPLEIKSGKDYYVHSALTRFVNTPDYHIKEGFVLCNSGEVVKKESITYLPIYFVMYFDANRITDDELHI